MASLVLNMSVSLDGYVAPVDGSTDWIALSPESAGAQTPCNGAQLPRKVSRRRQSPGARGQISITGRAMRPGRWAVSGCAVPDLVDRRPR